MVPEVRIAGVATAAPPRRDGQPFRTETRPFDVGVGGHGAELEAGRRPGSLSGRSTDARRSDGRASTSPSRIMGTRPSRRRRAGLTVEPGDRVDRFGQGLGLDETEGTGVARLTSGRPPRPAWLDDLRVAGAAAEIARRASRTSWAWAPGCRPEPCAASMMPRRAESALGGAELGERDLQRIEPPVGLEPLRRSRALAPHMCRQHADRRGSVGCRRAPCTCRTRPRRTRTGPDQTQPVTQEIEHGPVLGRLRGDALSA